MSRRFFALVAVGGLLLISCSDDSTSVSNDTSAATPVVVEETAAPEATEPAITEPVATEPAVIEPVPTEPVVTEPAVTEPVVEAAVSTIEFVGCEQVANYQPVDVVRTEGLVPDGIELIVDNDRVTSLFLAQQCTDVVVDGVSAGAAHVNSQWLPIVGPSEVRELPEYTDIPVLPTAYWTAVIYHTDNSTLSESAAAIGLDMLFVESMTFTSYTDSVNAAGIAEMGQTGFVTDATLEPPIDYSWFTGGFGPPTVEVVDTPSVFVHVVDGFDTECSGHIRLAGFPGALIDADASNEPLPGEPGEPGATFTVEYDSCTFTTIN